MHTGTSLFANEFVCVTRLGHNSENFDMTCEMIWNVPTLSSFEFIFAAADENDDDDDDDEAFTSATSLSTVMKKPVNLCVRPCDALKIPSKLTVFVMIGESEARRHDRKFVYEKIDILYK